MTAAIANTIQKLVAPIAAPKLRHILASLCASGPDPKRMEACSPTRHPSKAAHFREVRQDTWLQCSLKCDPTSSINDPDIGIFRLAIGALVRGCAQTSLGINVRPDRQTSVR